MAQVLTERYRARLLGVLSCYDRIVIMGTLPGVCYAQGMTSFLYAQGIRIFDYARFAEPLRDRIRARAERLAPKPAFGSSTSTSPISARKTWWPRCSRAEAIIRGWCT